MNHSHDCVLPLALDPVNESVHRGEHLLRLTPKAFAVLCYLMERPARLVTKDELLAAVWPDTAVTEASLSTCIREIRRALDDSPATPAYIQTVHRRGYRYVGAVSEATRKPHTSASTPATDALLVGREQELASLDRWLQHVEGSGRRLVFVAGEAGIGKTALVDQFVARVGRRTTAQIARGRCVAQYGDCEPYLPWLDLLNHLSRDYGRERLATTLRRCAPMWLAQLPWLVNAKERQQLQREIAGATRERMIRELAEVLAVVSADRLLVIVLEDLHWSDPSSIDLLAYLARPPHHGRLLLLGTYRPAELHATSHPLVALEQQLRLHGMCEALSLDFLTPEAVADYVRLRMPGAPDDLAIQVHRRTDGSPLFMINVIDYLLARGALVQTDGAWRWSETVQVTQTDVPESLKEMIERQLDRVSHDERRLLEAASVAGTAFSAASAAAALEESPELVEERLAGLARRGSFVRRTDREIWPDDTESDGYAFIHVLYKDVLYERIGTARRSRMHRLAGERLEAAYGDRAQEIAPELALHFERGRDAERAVRYLAQAGENAIHRGAYIEAIALLTRGIALLSKLPQGADRDAFEVELLVPLGACYINTRGYAAPEVGMTFERAHALCRHVTDASLEFRVLRGLSFFAEQHDLRKARTMAEELLRVGARGRDASDLVEAHRVVATTWFHLGNFTSALDHLERGLALYDGELHSSGAFLYGQDPGVCCHAWYAWAQWYRGFPDRAIASATHAIELARRIGHPFSLLYAMNFAAWLYARRGDAAAAERYTREVVHKGREQGLTPMLALGQVLHGWSLALQGRDEEGVRELQDGIARWQSTGAGLATPSWMYLLASALAKAGRSREALDTIDDALARLERTEERWPECELYILKGSTIARAGHQNGGAERHAEAERLLRRALHLAAKRESPALRLRAANALSPLLCDQGRTQEAEALVVSAYGAFTEGFQTPDLAEARSMLVRLRSA
jgi:DNA-binding winged helix-turn-helix (wHTH) protein/predicted ATPase